MNSNDNNSKTVIFTKDLFKSVIRYRSNWTPPESNILAKSLGFKNVTRMIGKEIPESILQEMVAIKNGYCKRKREVMQKKRERRKETTKQDYISFCMLFLTKKRNGKTYEDMLSFDINWDILSCEIKTYEYTRFLNTEYWRLIRGKKIEEAGARCSQCHKADRLEVHHTTYEHHGNELHHLDDLVVLCRKCHRKIHSRE